MIKLLCGALALAFLSAPASAMSGHVMTEIQAAINAAEAITCDVSKAASAGLSVESAINQGKATPVIRTGTTATVQTTSAAVCAALGGVAKATAK